MLIYNEMFTYTHIYVPHTHLIHTLLVYLTHTHTLTPNVVYLTKTIFKYRIKIRQRQFQ